VHSSSSSSAAIVRNTRGRIKGKLLRTTLVVEQKENGFSRPAQLSPSTPTAAASLGKNSPRGFLI